MATLIEKLKECSSSNNTSLAHKSFKKKRQKRRPLHTARILVDKVLAEEVFTCRETMCPCDLGIAVAPYSVLNGTITVTVVNCTPVICGALRPIQVDITLLIQKELTVTEPNGKTIPLEFTFYRQCRHFFSPIFNLASIDPKHIHCEVFEIKKACTDIDFVCANPKFNCHATLAEKLEVRLLLKLVAKEQLDVLLSHRHKANS